MELGLSLGGDPSTNPFTTTFLEKKTHTANTTTAVTGNSGTGLGLNPRSCCMELGLVLRSGSAEDEKIGGGVEIVEDEEGKSEEADGDSNNNLNNNSSSDRKSTDEEIKRDSSSTSSFGSDQNNQQPVQLDLLPFSPVPRPQHHQQQQPQQQSHQLGFRFPWLYQNQPAAVISEHATEPGTSGRQSSIRLDHHFRPTPPSAAEEHSTSPNSPASSFVEFSLFGNRTNTKTKKRPLSADRYLSINNGQQHPQPESSCDPVERAGSRGSDDDDNGGSTRKKLRLSKEQSAFLEESFKEHHTLNPKQKVALAKQLNLRPRQVEVWFQNRRARTKLKQTEVECEYLKRCFETLTEENRRLQKELHELRALKTSQPPFYMQCPATTLTMCPSCERVASTTTTSTTNTTTSTAVTIAATGNNNSKPPHATAVVTRPIATVATAASGLTTALTLAKSTLPFATSVGGGSVQQGSAAQPRQTAAS